MLNASIELSDLHDRHYIRLVGQNLTNRVYETASQVVGGLWWDAMYGPPRFFGVGPGIQLGGS